MLTAQKRKFALALMTGASKKDAAINAGYSEKSARSKGSQLAKDPEVIAFIERKKREKNEVDEYPTGGKNVYTPAVNIPDEDRDDTGPENLINNVFDDPLDFLRTVMNCSLVELVHCRTGSLEKELVETLSLYIVHCRTGSLENVA